MTKPLPFTQASVRRAIAAARTAGLRVLGIGPDGTVHVEDVDNSPTRLPDGPREASKWEDAEA